MKLSKDNYFSTEANKEFMSVSQFKSFLSCELAALAQINGEYDGFSSDSMLFGRAVHAWNEGSLKEFKQNNPELYKKDGTLYAKYAGIQDCIETLESDEVCMMALEGEKEVVFTAEMFGTPWKIMIDSYNPDYGMFTDLKVMKSLHDKFWSSENGYYVNFVEHYGYDMQMAVYSEVERIASGREERLEPHIVVVTKESPPDKAVLKGFLDRADIMLAQVAIEMPHILAVKSGEAEPVGCGKCEYCRSVKKAQIIDYRELI